MSRKHISACLRSPLVKTYIGNCICCSNLINFSSLFRYLLYGSIWCTCLCQSSTSILYPAACRQTSSCAPVKREMRQLWLKSPTTRPAIVVPKFVYADKHRAVTSSCGTFSCSRIYPSNEADLCQKMTSRLATAMICSSLRENTDFGYSLAPAPASPAPCTSNRPGRIALFAGVAARTCPSSAPKRILIELQDVY